MKVQWLALIAMPLLLALNFLCACGTSKQSAQPVGQSQSPQLHKAETGSSAATGKANHKIDFAEGGSPVQSFDGLRPKEVILNCLKEHRDEIDLELPSAFMSKISRDDLLTLETPGAKIVRSIKLPASDLTDFEIEPLSHMPLHSLMMGGNKLIDLHAIAKMQTLSQLDVSRSPISDAGFDNISGLHLIRDLNLAGTPISDRNLAAICRLRNLAGIDLTGCTNLSKEAVQQFKKAHPNCIVTFAPELSKDAAAAELTLHQVERELMGQHEYNDADLTLAKLISRCEAQNPPPYSLIGQAYLMQADCQIKMQHPQKARSLLEAALLVYSSHLPGDARFPIAKTQLAFILEGLGLTSEALRLRQEADTIWQRIPAQGMDIRIYSANRQKLKLNGRP